ncbi:hypothetical protein AMELA_G00171910, partial [Ameiurus melas]
SFLHLQPTLTSACWLWTETWIHAENTATPTPWPPTSTSPIPHAPTDEGVVQVNWGSSSMNLTRYYPPSQMMELLFCSLNNLLDTKQSGFKSNHSTETALLSVTEALRLARATSRSSVLILLDLSTAFDTVNHQILLSTLSNLGITGTVLRWVESYLLDRSFKVSWSGGIISSIENGLIDGSCSG